MGSLWFCIIRPPAYCCHNFVIVFEHPARLILLSSSFSACKLSLECHSTLSYLITYRKLIYVHLKVCATFFVCKMNALLEYFDLLQNFHVRNFHVILAYKVCSCNLNHCCPSENFISQTYD